MRANVAPNREKNATLIAAEPTLKRGLRKYSRFSIGCRLRRCHAMNAAPSTTAAARQPSTRASFHPRSGASMTP